ncbi:MAG: delta-60 repeat domain-containing protein, partial [Verrucomicrobiales bacterium]|nr:delta-60 repeat domain-containing protein [Verrucomicrobiales bacterium]
TVVTIRNHPAGSLDSTFVADPILRGQVGRIGFAPGGKVFIDHSLPYNQLGTPSILRRLNEDGSMDGLFKSSIHQNLVHWVARNDGGVYVITTDFSRLQVASVAPDGTQDGSFPRGIGFANASILAGPDGRLIGCRDLYDQGEGPRWKLVRLNHDGSEDSSFPSPTFGSPPRLIGFSPDQGLLVQGLLLGGSRLGFWRIDEHGNALSTAFPEDASIYGSLQLLPQGGLLGFLHSPDTDAIPFRFRLRRFLADGTEDPTFHSDVTTEQGFPGAAGVVTQPDGKLLVWGSPLRYGSNTAGDPLTTSVLRLWPTGAVDGIFELEPDGNAYIGQLLPDPTGGILATPLRESFTQRGDLPLVRLLTASDTSFILGAEPLPNGTLRLKLHLALGEGVVVERSEDLQAWQSASATLTHPTHEFLDPLASGQGRQFYRIRIHKTGPAIGEALH